MSTAVVYARYSSHNQREVSIVDQYRVCEDYCERKGIRIVKLYKDEARSGTNDRRPDFQLMVANAPESDYVVVYGFDRFSRGKYDAPLYKKELEEKGVRVLSATEDVPDTAEGIYMEKMYEANAAYYSLKLSRDVKRGLNSNAEKCMANGCKVFGYDIVDGYYIVNESQAAVVREIFARYIEGECGYEIWRDLRDRGLLPTAKDKNFIYRTIKNPKYVGYYKWGEIEKPGGMPAIVDVTTFRAAQKTTHGKVRALEDWTDYRLTGKLKCGKCGLAMHGESATNRHGTKYRYYCCSRGKCDRKAIRADYLERQIMDCIQPIADDPAVAARIASFICAQYKGEDSARAAREACEQRLKDNKRENKALVDAIVKGVEVTPDLVERSRELKREYDRLESQLGVLRAEEMELSVEELTEFLLHGFENADEDMLLDMFARQVYLFDDYAVVVLNYRNETNELEEIRVALENESSKGSFDFDLAAQSEKYTNFVLLRHAVGFVISLAA